MTQFRGFIDRKP